MQCSDSACGQSTSVIINPVTHKVTRVVVQDKSLPENPTRLVLIDKAASTTQNQITPNCTKAVVAKMQPFIVARFVQASGPGQAYSSEGRASTASRLRRPQ